MEGVRGGGGGGWWGGGLVGRGVGFREVRLPHGKPRALGSGVNTTPRTEWVTPGFFLAALVIQSNLNTNDAFCVFETAVFLFANVMHWHSDRKTQLDANLPCRLGQRSQGDSVHAPGILRALAFNWLGLSLAAPSHPVP